MKNIILLISVIFTLSTQTAFSQCTPIEFPGPGVSLPDTLLPATEGKMYNQVISIRIPKDTIYMGAVLSIDSAGIHSVTGVPNTITWQSNSPNDYWPGNSHGCILVEGTPTSDQVGKYMLSVIVEVHGFGTSLPMTLTYDFEIMSDSTMSIRKINDVSFMLNQNHPNPFDYSTVISYVSHKSSMMNFKVYDLLGNCVYENRSKSKVGMNDIKFERGNLSNGIYIYELNDGVEIVRKRMIIK